MQPLIDIVIDEFGHEPYLILIACLLSLRAKDSTTVHVCRELFARVKTPQQLLKLPVSELERIIFKTGFYKNKAKVLRGVSNVLLEQYGGKVPDKYDELISIDGVGPKTANLVLGMAFGKPAICVDTHVHRISNRLGLIKTKTVEQTEQQLKKVLPQKYWTVWNHLLVMWGQNVCVPISPKCSECVLKPHCKRIGVIKSR
ncbi:MAG: endonuclease III [Epsilonproteobacteria bacterium]|nr:endonuclease III [Campylobacterota bacterium]